MVKLVFCVVLSSIVHSFSFSLGNFPEFGERRGFLNQARSELNNLWQWRQTDYNATITKQLGINKQISYQESSIGLSRKELEQPLYLRVKSSEDIKLSGAIHFGDRVLRELEAHYTEVDLSSLLTPGRNEIKIVGEYQPANSVITVEIQGKNNTTSQSTGGSGVLQQKLVINVY